MARIAGINIPMNKHVWVGLTSIYGVGSTQAKKACEAAGVKPETKVKDLTEAEVAQIAAPLLGWDDERTASEKANYTARAAAELAAQEQPNDAAASQARIEATDVTPSSL